MSPTVFMTSERAVVPGVTYSTGENFPDALAGGVLPGSANSVMLLTRPDELPGNVAGKMNTERDWIGNVFYLGGTAAISQDVRDEVAGILK
ncbi:MAG: cell wall-binding repeat-containing protein [Actinomycetota bacterium]|jgi:hypothetical protein|nr:cell wall-binding repeat-containing protein [Actinomycetota bacterium]